MHRLSTGVLAGLSSLALLQAATAADLSVKAPVQKAPVIITWAGWYVGANAGGHWPNDQSVNIDGSSGGFNPAQANAPIFAAAYLNQAIGSFDVGDGSGFIGGGQVGYNWQFANVWLTGLEADIQGLSQSGGSGTSSSSVVDPFGNTLQTTVSVNKSLEYFGTVRGRLGWLATPSLLAYGTGGLAYGGVKSSACISQTDSNIFIGGASTCGGSSQTRFGWTVGGGLEWMFAPQWSLKGEYLYYDLGDVDYDLSIAPLVLAGAAGAGSPMFVNSMHATTRFNGSIARVGVNYHF
jgi:outer membrane immunogenic protein